MYVLFRLLLNKKSFPKSFNIKWRNLYVQGQSISPNVREYFYYIDHQGMVSKHFNFEVLTKSLNTY